MTTEAQQPTVPVQPPEPLGRLLKNIRRNVRVRMALLEMTTLDVATAAGVTRAAVYQWLADGNEISLATLCKLATALRCSVAQLVAENASVDEYIQDTPDEAQEAPQNDEFPTNA